jgi:hypothetical protein
METSEADRIMAAHPGWRVWLGQVTTWWWATPPPGFEDHVLISAPDPGTLETRIVEAEGQQAGLT